MVIHTNMLKCIAGQHVLASATYVPTYPDLCGLSSVYSIEKHAFVTCVGRLYCPSS